MKTKFNYLRIIIYALIFLISCDKQHLIQKDLNKATSELDFSISQDEALTNLNLFLKNGIRGGKVRTITRAEENVFPVRLTLRSNKTKSSLIEEERTVMYIANFDNNQGYAFLSADKRLEAPVIAIIDSGYLSQNDISNTIKEYESAKPKIYNQYPLTGAGIISDPNSEELFINPNTFDFYDKDEDDFLIGYLDYSLFEDEADVETKSPITRMVNSDFDDKKSFDDLLLCCDYVAETLIKDDPLIDDGYDYRPPQNYVRNDNTTTEYKTELTITDEVKPLLKKYYL